MGEGWEGVIFGKRGGDRHPNAFRVCQHVVVPESQYPVALAFEKAVPLRFLYRRLIVLSAIDFDDQPGLVARKIGDVLPERHLSAKAMAANLARPQHCPDGFLSFGHVLPQRSGADCGRRCLDAVSFRGPSASAITPSRPSPIKGEGYIGTAICSAAADWLIVCVHILPRWRPRWNRAIMAPSLMCRSTNGPS